MFIEMSKYTFYFFIMKIDTFLHLEFSQFLFFEPSAYSKGKAHYVSC